MTQYIEKSDLVAGIEDKINKYTKRGEESDAKRDGYGMYWGGVLSCLNEVRSFLDTLEVKEFVEYSPYDLDPHSRLESLTPILYFGMKFNQFLSLQRFLKRMGLKKMIVRISTTLHIMMIVLIGVERY